MKVTDSGLNKYINMAIELKMTQARLISTDDIFFDKRALLKCLWGCEDFSNRTIKCSTRNTTLQERIEMVKAYEKVLLVHAHMAAELSKAVLRIEREAFLDGYYFAFAIRACNLCKNCALADGKSCPTPEKIRPCDQSFGIDVFKTVRQQGFPCEVLKNKEEVQNRYGFVLIE